MNIVLNWQAVTTYTDGTAIPPAATVTYNLQGAEGPPIPAILPQLATGIVGTTTTRTNVDAATHYYTVTAVVNGVESAQSNEVTVTPQEVPNAPTNLMSTS